MSTIEQKGALKFVDKEGNVHILRPGTTVDRVEGLPDLLDEYLMKSGGTMTGDLILAGPPTEDLHPATKKYVDAGSVAANAVSGQALTKADQALATANSAVEAAASAEEAAANASDLASTHASRHAIGGDDSITPAMIGAERVYYNIDDFSSSGTLSAVWENLPDRSAAFINTGYLADESWNFPDSENGNVVLRKHIQASTCGEILLHGKTADYRMFLDGSTPTGEWVQIATTDGVQKKHYYYDLASVGLTSESTLTDAWNALPMGSVFTLNATLLQDASWNFPAFYGTLRIERSYYSECCSIQFFGTEATVGVYRMYLDATHVPTGQWVKETTAAEVEAAQGRADEAYALAKAASDAASVAQSTADTAKSDAAAAQEDADLAVEAAANAWTAIDKKAEADMSNVDMAALATSLAGHIGGFTELLNSKTLSDLNQGDTQSFQLDDDIRNYNIIGITIDNVYSLAEDYGSLRLSFGSGATIMAISTAIAGSPFGPTLDFALAIPAESGVAIFRNGTVARTHSSFGGSYDTIQLDALTYGIAAGASLRVWGLR